MMRIFLILIIVVPALEIFTMIQVGQVIGGWQTFLLIIGTSVLGAYLLKVQGRSTWRQINRDMEMRVLPGDSLLDGACVVVGGTLLLVPGFLSDIVGLLMLLPGLREIPKHLIKLYLMRMMQKGNFSIYRKF
ncbi:membrane protein FxsA [Tumebacillus algifaecis]|uniref:Membrane protein FxsA n=1 Tax=Tumebacillus algifaecis TaxID=1214604 RepID=A0A223CZK5_9BACL|nr:FxsA family protein [Tumebacillus algifaecis]ASS74517.1 membrane protein FxsA [Tumebacillus algifaecis]